MKNILVTGGAGFIGSNLCKKLKDLNYNVSVVDDLSTGIKDNIPFGCEFFKLDLSLSESFDKLPKNFDAVFHLASQVSSEDSCDNPINDLRRNAFSTLQLLQWIRKVNIKKIIYTSTMGVYKDNQNKALSESMLLSPKSFYGIGKMCSEEYIRLFFEEGLNTTIFRLFNVFGPGQDLDNYKQGMVSIYLSYILKNKPILVKGPLNRKRDYVYIDDVINGLLIGLEKGSEGKTYNLCSGKPCTVDELIKILLRETKNEANYPIKILPRTPKDIDSIYGDYSKIKKDFGWRPQYELRDGIKTMVSSYRNFKPCE